MPMYYCSRVVADNTLTCRMFQLARRALAFLSISSIIIYLSNKNYFYKNKTRCSLRGRPWHFCPFSDGDLSAAGGGHASLLPHIRGESGPGEKSEESVPMIPHNIQLIYCLLSEK